ncbi:hypothetical protein [Mycobacterium palustre]|uniref:Uncharacterized protein n=1 Tax=Mycobacterium palustre TaxID=153971 RepID=A0A1X1Z1M5_9MYCO|nr:hypothetical protein [Mycobacterium palustre]MCV7104167.1 hypothetical protein [Mycobacterium palustre]ORW17141.1 hypothetical protein AWC19_00955 [Mycobacterium palustre]
MDEDDFLVAVGEAAQDAVWKTQHPLTHHLAPDDPRRAQYLREYQMAVGRRVLTAIETLRRGSSSEQGPGQSPPPIPPKPDFAPFC